MNMGEQRAQQDLEDPEWKHPRFGVEHVHRVDLEDSEEEAGGLAKAFEQTCSTKTRDEMTKLRKELHRWSTKGAQLISDKFGQKAMEDAFQNQIAFDDNNR